jgi:hydrogenase maturation protein HypF
MVGERRANAPRSNPGTCGRLAGLGVNAPPAFIAQKLVVGGRVQGVGFRPFVYRVAQRFGIQGWVRNRSGEVEVLAQGAPELLQRFRLALVSEAPPLARPTVLSEFSVAPEPIMDFQIRGSEAALSQHIHLPPDHFACDECLAEVQDSRDRRYRYPFINCTQCGPRYTLIERLPYDRANTSMAHFPLCAQCAAEYADPGDRRFHAEPLACPQCGPRLEFRAMGADALFGITALAATVAALRSGKIVAIKGIGGYHLVCDAANSAAVGRLRARKRRPDKPLAVMFPLDPGLAALRRATVPNPIHEAMLLDPVRPVVLTPKNPTSDLASEIAPHSAEIGAMLPYSPLHDLLLKDFGAALVATSGNITGEPVLTDNDMAEARLGAVADAFLHHNRNIVRPADDPVYRVIGDKPRPIRLGRGNAPAEIELSFSLPRPLLALGGHLKNTVALGWGQRAVVSPHLGDMDTPRGLELLKSVATDLQSLYGVQAQMVLCDAHPGYATTRLAPQLGMPVIKIFHHEAHASALAEEFDRNRDWLVFTWDGAGFGRDETMWGGEALLGRPGRWRRVATIRPFALLGGERAAREPWRNALALFWEAGRDWEACPRETAVLRHAWKRKLNCPPTSSIGRLFDGAAALLGLVEQMSYEGQAASHLEAICVEEARPIALRLSRRADGIWESDWSPLLDCLTSARQSASARAAVFHATLAEALLAQARAVRAEYGVSRVGLTGGVFQNRVLCEHVLAGGRREGVPVFIPERLPCNDAGLSFGQIVEAGAHDRR